MNNYPNEDLVLIAHCLQCCEYAVINLEKMTPTIHATPRENISHSFFIRRVFLVKGFITNFGQVLSYFHKADDHALFTLMQSTFEQRKIFYDKVRGVSAHISEFKEHINGVIMLLSGTDNVNWFNEFQIVRDYVYQLINNAADQGGETIITEWDKFIEELENV